MDFVKWENKKDGKDNASVEAVNEAFASIDTSLSNAQSYSDSIWANASAAQSTADNALQSIDTLSQKVEEIDNDLAALSSGLNSGGVIVHTAYNADRATMDDKYNLITETYATKAEVGDIETALDSIISIQNELIGGGA